MRIFISSPIAAFRNLRSSLAHRLHENHFEVFVSELEGPHWQSPAAELLRQIADADIIVCILGSEYGSVPARPASDGPEQVFDGLVSVSHGEFRFAKILNKPVLVYVQAGTVNDERQRAFIAEVSEFFGGEYRCSFADEAELCGRVPEDILQLLTKVVRGDYRYPAVSSFSIVKCANWEEVAELGARKMLQVIESVHNPCISITSGRTVSSVYRKFIGLYCQTDLRGRIESVEFLSNNEYFGVGSTNPLSIRGFLKNSFFDPLGQALGVDLSRKGKLQFLPGQIRRGTLVDLCAEYDALFGQSLINLQLLGTCPVGTTLFVEPDTFTLAELLQQRTSLVRMSDYTHRYAFPKAVSHYVMTVGIGNVLSRSQEVLLLISGPEKAEIARQLLASSMDTKNPTLALRVHRQLTVGIDVQAAAKLPPGWEAAHNVKSLSEWKAANA